jgi:histidine triad (HIT) family protein
MPTIFTRIIDGEFPGTFVWRDERAVGFMSINPLATGHVLVVPIVEVDHWIDLDAPLAAHVFEVARVIGAAQAAAFRCARVGLIVAGYEVPHAHVHVIPTNSMSQLNFANAASRVDPAELESAAEAIRTQLRAAGHADTISAPT